jgi:hypothetical protein
MTPTYLEQEEGAFGPPLVFPTERGGPVTLNREREVIRMLETLADTLEHYVGVRTIAQDLTYYYPKENLVMVERARKLLARLDKEAKRDRLSTERGGLPDDPSQFRRLPQTRRDLQT